MKDSSASRSARSSSARWMSQPIADRPAAAAASANGAGAGARGILRTATGTSLPIGAPLLPLAIDGVDELGDQLRGLREVGALNAYDQLAGGVRGYIVILAEQLQQLPVAH